MFPQSESLSISVETEVASSSSTVGAAPRLLDTPCGVKRGKASNVLPTNKTRTRHRQQKGNWLARCWSLLELGRGRPTLTRFLARRTNNR